MIELFIEKIISTLMKACKMKRLVLLLIPILIWGASCNRDVKSKEEIVYLFTPPEPGDVYVSGIDEDNVLPINKAILWKNCEKQILYDGTLYSEANSVFVKESNVYVAGSIGNNAVLWIDGVAQNLSEGAAKSVYAVENYIYVAGYEINKHGNHVATVWVNGAAQNLSDETMNAEAISIYAFEGDVYVAGRKLNDQNTQSGEIWIAALWKNGVAQNLSNDNSAIASVFFSGGDVYIVRSVENYYAVSIWKNGEERKITDDLYRGYYEISSLFVSDKDVYVLGHQYPRNALTRCIFWKNGEVQISCSEGSFHSIYVTGDGNTYAAGKPVGSNATLWKNGISQELPGKHPHSCAYSVFVVE